MTIPIALVDDDALWLDLLRVALDGAGAKVLATFRDASEALAAWPDDATVALIDIDLGPDSMSGFALARQLRNSRPGLGIVFLTSVLDPWLFDDAAASAVEGTSYLLKGSVGSVRQLRSSIEAAARGEVTVDEAIAETLGGQGPLPGLNAMQVRILRMMATGRSNAEIAENLGISPKTVEANITRTARALDVPAGTNIRVGCVTRYLAAAVSGPHGTIRP